MSKGFNYIIFAIVAIVLVVSFVLTYNGGEDFAINQSEYRDENILVNIYQNNEDDKINLQMASINPEMKVEVSFDSSTSSTFAPGYSTFEHDNLNFNMKTYRQWLKIIWLPYQTIEVDLDREDLEELPEDGLIKFEAEFAERLMEYYTINQ
ncbi:MAG: hypothetical protein R6V14_05410 [Halanaerobiales bacterium]